LEYYLYHKDRAEGLFGRDYLQTSKNRQMSYWSKQLLIRKAHRKGLSNCAYKFTREGKPFFIYHPEFHFSISHNQDWIGIAFSNHSVGIDIEKLRVYKPMLVKRFFHPKEYEFLQSFNFQDEKNEAFTRLWTLKEAYVKCTGTGIANNFDKFAISFKLIKENKPVISICENSTRVSLASFYQEGVFISIAEEY
jgi:Phosphopantetheinyl transferase